MNIAYILYCHRKKCCLFVDIFDKIKPKPYEVYAILECPKMQKFGNVLLPRQKVMQMISETMPTSKKLPYLKV